MLRQVRFIVWRVEDLAAVVLFPNSSALTYFLGRSGPDLSLPTAARENGVNQEVA